MLALTGQGFISALRALVCCVLVQNRLPVPHTSHRAALHAKCQFKELLCSQEKCFAAYTCTTNLVIVAVTTCTNSQAQLPPKEKNHHKEGLIHAAL